MSSLPSFEDLDRASEAALRCIGYLKALAPEQESKRQGYALAVDLAMKGLEKHLPEDADAISLVRKKLEEAACQMPNVLIQSDYASYGACAHVIAINLALKARCCAREVASTTFGVDFHQPYDPETDQPGHEVAFGLLPNVYSPEGRAEMDKFHSALGFLDAPKLDGLEVDIGREAAQARVNRKKAAQISEQPAVKTAQEQEPPSQKDVFKMEGETWTLAFGHGIQRGLKEVKGHIDVEYLLRHQGKSIPIEDLPNNMDDDLGTQDVPVATKQDGIDLLKQIIQLDSERKNVEDPLVKGELDKEVEALRRDYNQNFNKHGEPRKLPGAKTKMIARTKKRFGRLLERLPEKLRLLGDHLSKNVTIDGECTYSPEQAVDWDLGD